MPGDYVDDVLAMHQVTERVGRGIVDGEMVRDHHGIEMQFGRDGILEFEEDRFSMVPTKDRLNEEYITVRGGVPTWVQYPEIPLCPGSGRPMTFLCQLDGGPKLTTEAKTRLAAASDVPTFDAMHWWSDGDLFVFAAPGENVICLLAQNS